MKLEFHPAVQQDFIQARDYYQTKGGPHLADRFEREFQACLSAIQLAPSRFPFYLGSEIFRRIRLRHFPWPRLSARGALAAAPASIPNTAFRILPAIAVDPEIYTLARGGHTPGVPVQPGCVHA
jgi:plasmid stabilization system protein ParE